MQNECVLVAELRVQFRRVKERQAWVSSRQVELWPGNQASLHGLMNARQQCEIEKSVLAGHAMLIESMLKEHGVMPDGEL